MKPRLYSESLLLGADHFGNDILERPGDPPVGEVTLELSQVGDVADVIAQAVPIVVAPVNLVAADVCNQSNALQYRSSVGAPSPEVVDLSRPRRLDEGLESPDDVVAVDLVAHLLALVAEYGVRLARHGNVNEIRQETV